MASEYSDQEGQDRKALREKEELQKDDAAENARQLKEDFTKAEISRQQERERQASETAQREREWNERERALELYEREQARQQEQRRREIEAQRQRESEAFAREKELLAIERSGQKPAYADVKRAEALRNAHELNALQETQQRARENAFADTDKMGPEEGAAARKEKGNAMEKQFREELERLAREQQERAERLAELYGERRGRAR